MWLGNEEDSQEGLRGVEVTRDVVNENNLQVTHEHVLEWKKKSNIHMHHSNAHAENPTQNVTRQREIRRKPSQMAWSALKIHPSISCLSLVFKITKLTYMTLICSGTETWKFHRPYVRWGTDASFLLKIDEGTEGDFGSYRDRGAAA